MPPRETMAGSLCHYLASADAASFQPMNANFGLLPALPEPVRPKRARRQAQSKRALTAMASWSREALPELVAMS